MTKYPNWKGMLIGVPHTGRGLPPQWTYSMMNLHPPMNFNVTHAITYGKNVDDAYNYFAEQALSEGAAYMFTVEEDVTIPAHGLRQLWYHLERHPEAAACSGIVFHKGRPQLPMVFRGNGRGPYIHWKVGELFEVSGCGMGCLLLRVDALKKLEKPFFKTVSNTDRFLDGEQAADEWTQDLYFFKKLTDAGFKVLADAGIICEHWDLETMQPYGPPVDAPCVQLKAVPKGKMKVLDLGAGEWPVKMKDADVTTVDIRDEVKPDYRCDIRVLPFASGTFDIVYSSHTFEHLPRKDVDKALDEAVRVMKPDGELRLGVPNIEWAADQVKKGVLDDDVMNVIYGDQRHDENYHSMGFTPKLVEQMLKKRGFKRMDFELRDYNIWVRAWKLLPKGKKSCQ